MRIAKIISGGQTGADRAALDWAIRAGIEHGGWCPRGRLAEDGPIPSKYQLRETPSDIYAERTEWNVRDADATVIFSGTARLNGGSALTEKLAAAYGRPCLHLQAALGIAAAALRLQEFVVRYAVKVLNVAGPRASTEPDVGLFATQVLNAAFPPTLTLW